jgi:hypothetical protein
MHGQNGGGEDLHVPILTDEGELGKCSRWRTYDRGKRASDELEEKIRQTRRNLMRAENKLVINWLNLNMSLAGLSWPLYIGGNVSRIQ